MLSIAGRPPLRLGRGDFILLPTADDFMMSSVVPPPSGSLSVPTQVRPGVFHLGEPGTPDTRMLVGYCAFGSDDATLLVELLSEEARAERPGRNVVLARLLEVLLIEAFRATTGATAPPGLLRGLADERVAAALRRIHGEPAYPWTIGELAKASALSRSTFFDRFRREVGVRPMEYLLGWRMALAKELLRSGDVSVGEVAGRVGYSSQSTFSVAFARQIGMSPTAYARGRPMGSDHNLAGDDQRPALHRSAWNS